MFCFKQMVRLRLVSPLLHITKKWLELDVETVRTLCMTYEGWTETSQVVVLRWQEEAGRGDALMTPSLNLSSTCRAEKLQHQQLFTF